jgi:hypothetical protein
VRRYVITAAVLLLVGIGVLSGRQMALALSASPAPGHSFRISGTAAGLMPGKAVPLTVTVTNPDAQPIRVTSTTVTAQAAGRDCPSSLLTITSFTGTPQTIVPARGHADIQLSITLSVQAPDACRDVSFSLSFTGRAEQWQ